MEHLQCKRVSHLAYSPDILIAGFICSERLKGLWIVKVSSGEKVLEAVTGIVRTIVQAELKSVFFHSVYRCDWIVAHNGKKHQNS
jgi:hypothetical protein